MHTYLPLIYAILTSGTELSRKRKEKGGLEKGELETHIIFLVTSLIFTLLLTQIKERDLEIMIEGIFIFTVCIFEFNTFPKKVKRPVYTREINLCVLCVLYLGYYYTSSFSLLSARDESEDSREDLSPRSRIFIDERNKHKPNQFTLTYKEENTFLPTKKELLGYPALTDFCDPFVEDVLV